MAEPLANQSLSNDPKIPYDMILGHFREEKEWKALKMEVDAP